MRHLAGLWLIPLLVGAWPRPLRLPSGPQGPQGPCRILHSAVPCLPFGLHESVLVHQADARPFLDTLAVPPGHAWYVVDLVPDLAFTTQNVTTLLSGKTVPSTVRVWSLPRPPTDDREWGVWIDTFPYWKLRGPPYNLYTNNCIHYARNMVSRMRSECGTENPPI